ncbi:MAG: FkbM family methyltransferase [Synergistaceae bacterium]|nr:FkbM family methyltransferase [Synergistaceae bacterium]
MSEIEDKFNLFFDQLNGEKIRMAYDASFNNPEIKFLCLYGAGAVGKNMLEYYRKAGIKVDFFCDRDPGKIGRSIEGIPCISIDEIKAIKGEALIILSTGSVHEVLPILEANGLTKYNHINESQVSHFDFFKDETCHGETRDNVMKLMRILSDEQSKKILYTLLASMFSFNFNYEEIAKINEGNQYFADDIILLSDESFVDVGAFDGDTVKDFISRSNGQFREISAIEMNYYVFQRLEKNVSTLNYPDKIHCYNCGLYDKTGVIKYSVSESGSAIINGRSSETVKEGHSARMDDLLDGKRVTFIKMDIEGAEMNALKGAQNIIRSQKPKCAICVYHNPRHLWEVPFLLHEYCPSYKLYLRHHTELFYETVCYAIPE